MEMAEKSKNIQAKKPVTGFTLGCVFYVLIPRSILPFPSVSQSFL